eukprot:TRINITY_DN21010_c0_g1_i1.p1 TRINITY_DN21010_c0_g1~~TRINITY_DN21010_c0_g1_i1.p1  ORF type:complete len:504 (-),score=35.70 TRINITY_DN21010_c0_g1_i1:396-1841(-)
MGEDPIHIACITPDGEQVLCVMLERWKGGLGAHASNLCWQVARADSSVIERSANEWSSPRQPDIDARLEACGEPFAGMQYSIVRHGSFRVVGLGSNKEVRRRSLLLAYAVAAAARKQLSCENASCNLHLPHDCAVMMRSLIARAAELFRSGQQCGAKQEHARPRMASRARSVSRGRSSTNASSSASPERSSSSSSSSCQNSSRHSRSSSRESRDDDMHRLRAAFAALTKSANSAPCGRPRSRSPRRLNALRAAKTRKVRIQAKSSGAIGETARTSQLAKLLHVDNSVLHLEAGSASRSAVGVGFCCLEGDIPRIITAAHVVSGSGGGCARATAPNGQTCRLQLRDLNRKEDWAEFWPAEGMCRLKPLPLSRRRWDEIWVGEEVFTVCHPPRSPWSYSRGHISNRLQHAKLGSIEVEQCFQVEGFSIQCGYSGAPLMDANGHVIGIVLGKLNGFTICSSFPLDLRSKTDCKRSRAARSRVRP